MTDFNYIAGHKENIWTFSNLLSLGKKNIAASRSPSSSDQKSPKAT